MNDYFIKLLEYEVLEFDLKSRFNFLQKLVWLCDKIKNHKFKTINIEPFH